ncbi:MAG: VCBS repeat-containing protein [Verrucomicrobiales bacterium]|nr:VCBS repeat-containing protein [Verrucomicrobiales bacterium]
MRQLTETAGRKRTLAFLGCAGLLLPGMTGRVARCAEGDGWQEASGFRWRPLEAPAEGRVGFARLDPGETGITFENRLSEEDGAANRVLWNGSGLAVGDYDRDGKVDVFFCGMGRPNVLYRNLGGWRFQDVTAAAGLVFPGQHHRGAVFADLDGDGWLDLLVSANGRGVSSYRNLGNGRFADETNRTGTASEHGSGTLALADWDGNGTLDLYVCNYRIDDIRDQGEVSVEQRDGRLAVPARYQDRLVFRDDILLEYGEPDQWLTNDGQGRFTEVAWTGGRFVDEEGKPLSGPPLDWGLTASFRDVDDDGRPDLYVCNDYWTPDRFWRNRGDGVFQAVANEAIRHTSASAMSVDFTDIDLDGRLDFFVVDMLSRDPFYRKRQMIAQLPEATQPGDPAHRPQVSRNTLFRQRGDGTFEEIACYAGVRASDWSWSPVFMDVDLDGDDDLLVAAGHFKDVQDRDAFAEIQSRQRPRTGTTFAERRRQFREELLAHYRLYPYLPMPVVAFRNEGNRRFQETTDDWGTEQPGVHHAMAMGDFDGDGDLDFMVNNLDLAAGVYRNECPAPRIAVRLQGAAPNTQAVGAKVSLLGGSTPRQTREVIAGGRYLSGSETLLVFAPGAAADGLSLAVRWPNGRETRIDGVRPNRLYEIREQTSRPPESTSASVPATWFVDETARLNHRHLESSVNDFTRQPLLPFKLSQAGPGLAWFDVDGDGADELICGAGRGGAPAVLRRTADGRFEPLAMIGPGSVPGDTTGILGWETAPGQRELLFGLSAYESTQTNSVLRFRLAGGEGQPVPPLPNLLAGGGALALTVPGDGKPPWLFVGGQVLPGGYPLGGGSLLYRRAGNAWSLDRPGAEALRNTGLVNGARFSDLNGDGVAELILACEWGPVRVFAREENGWRERTEDWGLAPFTGLWKGVATVDLDNDGRLDLVAANLGLNTPYHASPERPLIFYCGDLAEMGSMAVIETEYDARGRLVPGRPMHVLAQSLPFLAGRFETVREYSAASVAEILGDAMSRAAQARATTLASMIFLNRGDRFEARPLPYEAQVAPAFSVHGADFDGDGNEDVFLSQNFFPVRVDFAPWDAGRGLLLRGDGRGNLAAVPGELAGIRIYGEQRGAAVGDFDGDGRADLAVSQNGGPVRLFRNRAAKPGLRIRLAGPAANPAGIGASIRVVYPDGAGPVREIHAGSGYWSQDSGVAVLGLRARPVAVEVAWPGGGRTKQPVFGDATALTIRR